MLYCIREKRLVMDPTQPIDYGALDIPEARPPLDADPATWLPGKWSSKREAIRWEPGVATHTRQSNLAHE